MLGAAWMFNRVVNVASTQFRAIGIAARELREPVRSPLATGTRSAPMTSAPTMIASHLPLEKVAARNKSRVQAPTKPLKRRP